MADELPPGLVDITAEIAARADATRRHTANGAEGGANGHPVSETLIARGEISVLQKVDWLWPGWLARGKLHILGGMKGAGKSTIAFDLLAQVTCAGRWPDGTPAPLGDVVVWSGEDDMRDTVLPRIYAAGGDVTRVHWPKATIVDGIKRAFDPATNSASLLEAARKLPSLTALLVDPIVSASAGDSHKNSETRRGLQPLVDLAVELNAVLLGITHFTKNTQGREPIERITGSLAFGAIPRVVWGAALGETEDAPRKLVRIASNIGRSGGGYEYLLRQDLLPGLDFTAQRCVWGKQLVGSPMELLGGDQAQSQKLGAVKFLDDMLAGGARVKVKDLKDAALAHSLSWRTVERAKNDIGTIIAEQVERAWHWRKKVAD